MATLKVMVSGTEFPIAEVTVGMFYYRKVASPAELKKILQGIRLAGLSITVPSDVEEMLREQENNRRKRDGN